MTLLRSGASALLFTIIFAGGARAEAAPTCPAPFDGRASVLSGYRVFTGPNGESQAEPFKLDVRQWKLKTGESISIFDLPTSPKRGVQIVTGPPNLSFAPHPTPYREMFIMIAGSTSVTTKGFKAEMKPGSVLLFEDMDAKDGHGGRTGPCGYTSISVAP